MRKFYCLVLAMLCLKNISAQIVYDNPLDSGVLVTAGKNIFKFAEPVSDGKNGVIILFSTYEKSDTIFVQRINSDGKIVWGNQNTAKIAAIKNSQDSDTEIWPSGVINDGNGGVFIEYYEYNISLEQGDVYVQHIDSNGNRLMNPGGVKVVGNGHRMIGYDLISDGGSGIIIAWVEDQYDYPNGVFQYSEAFVQKFSSTGTPQWQSGGIQLCHAVGMRRTINLVPDGSNGAVAVFDDSRNCVPLNNFDNLDLYAQRIDNNGSLQWSQTGVPVSTVSLTQQLVKTIKQSNGQGYLVSYTTNPGGNFTGGKELYIQHLDNAGQITWQQDEGSLIAIAEDGRGLESAAFESDGSGGAVLYWNDIDSANFDYTAFIQRVNASGDTVWPSAKINLLNGPGAYHTAVNMKRDIQGNFVYSAIAETADYSDGNFKLQKVDSNNNAKWGASGKNYVFRGDAILPTNDGIIVLFLRNYGEEITSFPYSQYENLLAYKVDFNGNLVWSSTPYRTMADGDWNDPLIWETGFVPPATGNITISNHLHVTENAVCNSLKILPGGNVTVDAGVALTVTH